MKRLLCAAFAAVALAASSASAEASKIATREWVQNYVTGYMMAVTNAVTVREGNTVKYAVSDGDESLVVTIEDFTDAALLATNATESAVSAGVTNGTLFVWDGGRRYLNPVGVIEATTTNMTYNGVGSTVAGEFLRFDGLFDVEAVVIQASQSLSVTNGMEVAK